MFPDEILVNSTWESSGPCVHMFADVSMCAYMLTGGRNFETRKNREADMVDMTDEMGYKTLSVRRAARYFCPIVAYCGICTSETVETKEGHP